MKKLFVSFLTLIRVVLTAAGCGSSANGAENPKYNTAKDGEWVEIQSITFDLNGSSQSTYTSNCISEYESEEITKDEYDNAPDDQKTDWNRFFGSDTIEVNRQELVINPSKFIGKIFYYRLSGYDNFYYSKAILTNLTMKYVKIRFLDDSTFELNYYENLSDEYTKTIRVKPVAYRVTYFNN